jgi:hypothetical protein
MLCYDVIMLWRNSLRTSVTGHMIRDPVPVQKTGRERIRRRIVPPVSPHHVTLEQHRFMSIFWYVCFRISTKTSIFLERDDGLSWAGRAGGKRHCTGYQGQRRGLKTVWVGSRRGEHTGTGGGVWSRASYKRGDDTGLTWLRSGWTFFLKTG